jgi:hypothetical protein
MTLCKWQLLFGMDWHSSVAFSPIQGLRSSRRTSIALQTMSAAVVPAGSVRCACRGNRNEGHHTSAAPLVSLCRGSRFSMPSDARRHRSGRCFERSYAASPRSRASSIHRPTPGSGVPEAYPGQLRAARSHSEKKRRMNKPPYCGEPIKGNTMAW